MYGATPMHPVTNLAASAQPPKRDPRTGLTGALVLALAWSLLAGSFLLDVARPPRGAGAWRGAAASTPALASAGPARTPCAP